MNGEYDDRGLIQQVFIDVNEKYKDKSCKWGMRDVSYQETQQVIKFFWKAMARHIGEANKRMFVIPHWGYMVWSEVRYQRMMRRLKRIQDQGFDSVYDFINYKRKESAFKKIDAIRRQHYGNNSI